MMGLITQWEVGYFLVNFYAFEITLEESRNVGLVILLRCIRKRTKTVHRVIPSIVAQLQQAWVCQPIITKKKNDKMSANSW